jgi:hypothetical protein
MIEVVAEYQVVGVDSGFWREGEADAVLVAISGVRGEREVGRCRWGFAREATVVLGAVLACATKGGGQ